MCSTLWQVTKASAAISRSAPALISPPQAILLSYGQLCDHARTLSDRLQKWGVKKGHLVATDLPNVAEGMLLHLACSRIGAAVATAKTPEILSNIGPVRCSVTATANDWLAEGKVGEIGSSPFLELLDINENIDCEKTLTDDGESHSSESPLGFFGSNTPLTHGKNEQDCVFLFVLKDMSGFF